NIIHKHCPTKSKNEIRNDIRRLIRFFSLVHGEKKFCNDTNITADIDNVITNGNYIYDRSDSSSRTGAPTGWINSLAGGGGVVAGVGGQSTLSRKSGNDLI
ncbi:unnamed protein product, partial [Rotaria sp. Silwood1]